MISQNESLVQAVPNFESELTNPSRLVTASRIAGRAALSLALAAGAGLAGGAASTMLEAQPYAAAANTGGYPDAGAPCVANNNNVSQGNGYWCSGYQWGYYIRNAQGQIVGNTQNSSRGYGYRNCTDWAAFRVKQITGVTVPNTMGNSQDWDNNAPAGYSVDNTPERGDIAVWEAPYVGAFGHVAVVETVNANGTVELSEYNKTQNGTYSTRNNVAASSINHFIDVNGPNAPAPPAVDPLSLSFVRLNYPGNVQVVSYLESSNYQTLSENALVGYPSVPPDGNVVPLFQKDGDLSLVRLNHGSGKVEVATYSEASNYQTLSEYSLSGYPSVPGDGSVIPLYQYDGDLSFIRLNHGSGKTEVVAYSAASNYQALTESTLTNYPAVSPDGSVIPAYWLNDDLVFFRMNHSSGNVELASYSKGSNYQQLANYQILPYPAVSAPGVAPDGAVAPMFQPQDGDLSFIRLNHGSGKVEIVTYAVGSQFQQMNDYDLSNYPAVPPDSAVVPLYSN